MNFQNKDLELIYKNIELEEKAQLEKFQLSNENALKEMKKEGLILSPIHVISTAYSWADYPEIKIKVFPHFPMHNFKDSAFVELVNGKDSCRAQIVANEGSAAFVRLYSSDFPEFLHDEGTYLKVAADTKTLDLLKDAVREMDGEDRSLRAKVAGHIYRKSPAQYNEFRTEAQFRESSLLNASQNQAVAEILSNEAVTIVHGPPGTGKTTTLLEALDLLIQAGHKVVVTATSNAAVDHFTRKLIQKQVPVLRIGNPGKIDEQILKHTIEGKLQLSNEQKLIKNLKSRAAEFRKMLHQYKRNFGKEEREQRKLILQEVKNIQKEIKSVQAYATEKILDQTSVVCGTPVALSDFSFSKKGFDILVIDEAGQMLEPFFYLLTRDVSKVILAGDHFQIPPTVISNEAAKKGFNQSILEKLVEAGFPTNLLDTQYRMRESIAAFSSSYFYESRLVTPAHLADTGAHIAFYDMVGFGNQEQRGEENASLSNPEELQLIQLLIEQEQVDLSRTTFISPYSAQIELARKLFPKPIQIATIDSYQGQENQTVIISLVRSNENHEIGFLKDYRRMNVAMTRAKERLIIVGDSATLSKDAFYAQFLDFIESKEAYHTVWEFPDMM